MSDAVVIRLDELLKSQGLVGTGGEAKIRIQSGEVTVNGQVETRRRRQLHVGDRICFGDVEIDIEPDGEVDPAGGVESADSESRIEN
ncbi:MAG: RNA-binding S4 domain-containing protein [Planctomycetota bacterium]